MSFAISEKPRLPRRTSPLTAMCLLHSFTAFSACDPCLTRVIWTCMFAICPPLFRAARSTLPFSGGLITISASLCCSGAFSFPTLATLFKPALPTQTPQLDSHELPPTRRASPVCEALQYMYIYIYTINIYIYLLLSYLVMVLFSPRYVPNI